jgi:hypothetical protein
MKLTNVYQKSNSALLHEWIAQVRFLCRQNKDSVKINYNQEQAVASFYVKGKLVDTSASSAFKQPHQ